MLGLLENRTLNEGMNHGAHPGLASLGFIGDGLKIGAIGECQIAYEGKAGQLTRHVMVDEVLLIDDDRWFQVL